MPGASSFMDRGKINSMNFFSCLCAVHDSNAVIDSLLPVFSNALPEVHCPHGLGFTCSIL